MVKNPVATCFFVGSLGNVPGLFFCGTQRKLGQLIKQGQESGEIAGHGGDRADSKIAGGNLAPKTYEEIGIAVRHHSATMLQRYGVTYTRPIFAPMSKIIAIGNQKGGTGKTTVTSMLANAFSQEPFNLRVFVGDCDPQQSIIRRRLADQQQTDEPAPYKVAFFNTLAELQADIERMDRENDLVFIDLPGRLDTHKHSDQQETARFLQYIDTLFIPFCPGNYALESTLEYLRTVLKIANLRKENPRPMSVVGFVNLYEGGRTVDDRALLEEVAEIQVLTKIKFLETRLQRYALFRATDTFTSFFDPTSSDRATLNITKFISEFKKMIL